MENPIFDSDIFLELKTHNIHFNTSIPRITCNNKQPGLYVVYSRECFHCISMAPLLKNLKEMLRLKNMEHSIICGMDIMEKDNKYIIDKLHIKYVPKLYIIKSSGNIIEFNGNTESVQSIYDAIYKQKSNELILEIEDKKSKIKVIKKRKKKISKKNKKKKKSKGNVTINKIKKRKSKGKVKGKGKVIKKNIKKKKSK